MAQTSKSGACLKPAAAPAPRQSVFRSAIHGDDGTVDPGYLALFWALVGWSVSGALLLAMGIAAIVMSGKGDAATVILNVGGALGAISVGFGTVVGAVGLFRAGDKPRAGAEP